jgi:hypothetical protein
VNNAFALVRAARGPILLIVLGVLMSLHRYQDISFTKTWPVLLILLGVMKLFERMALQSAGVPPAGPYQGTGPQF